MSLFAFCCAYWLAAALALVVGLHRGLAHGAVRFRFGFGRLLSVLALPAGTPVQWAGTHRQHHARADQPGDPHSPWQGGFWHSHCGWYIGTSRPMICLAYALGGPLRMAWDAWHRPRTNQQFIALAPDAAQDRFLAFLSLPRPYALAMAAHILVPFGFAWACWGASGVLALWATLILIYNGGDGVNSLGHLWGETYPGARSQARNHPVLGLLAFGDGWHANHHRFPGKARAGSEGRFDAGWTAIKWLRRVGLAGQVRILDPEGVGDGALPVTGFPEPTPAGAKAASRPTPASASA
jgi:stearoyl-CoA desaturase (delta-9 desaturase)